MDYRHYKSIFQVFIFIILAEICADFDAQVNMHHDEKQIGLVVNKHDPQETDINIDKVKKNISRPKFCHIS